MQNLEELRDQTTAVLSELILLSPDSIQDLMAASLAVEKQAGEACALAFTYQTALTQITKTKLQQALS